MEITVFFKIKKKCCSKDSYEMEAGMGRMSGEGKKRDRGEGNLSKEHNLLTHTLSQNS